MDRRLPRAGRRAVAACRQGDQGRRRAGAHRAGKPQQNGRLERLHLTLLRDSADPPARSLRQQIERLRSFQRLYNDERPHQALGNDTPAKHYVVSPRRFDGVLRERVTERSRGQAGAPQWRDQMARQHDLRHFTLPWRGRVGAQRAPGWGAAAVRQDVWRVRTSQSSVSVAQRRAGFAPKRPRPKYFCGSGFAPLKLRERISAGRCRSAPMSPTSPAWLHAW